MARYDDLVRWLELLTLLILFVSLGLAVLAIGHWLLTVVLPVYVNWIHGLKWMRP